MNSTKTKPAKKTPSPSNKKASAAAAKTEASTTPQHRARRARGTPSWLEKTTPDVNEVARQRTLMLLSVLTGEVPVSTAIERADISRQTYYLWETRALQAVLAAMVPTELAPGFDPAVTPEQRIASLERQLTKSERERQRAERMLSLTRQTLRAVPVTTGARGRPRGPRPTVSMKPGSNSSKPSKSATSTSERTPAAPSIPSENSGATL